MDVVKNTNTVFALEKLRLHKAQTKLFTRKQLETIRKVLAMETLSNKEEQAFSRVIKPRLNAIIDFHEIAIICRDKGKPVY